MKTLTLHLTLDHKTKLKRPPTNFIRNEMAFIAKERVLPLLRKRQRNGQFKVCDVAPGWHNSENIPRLKWKVEGAINSRNLLHPNCFVVRFTNLPPADSYFKERYLS